MTEIRHVILRRSRRISRLIFRSFTSFRMTIIISLLTCNFYLLILPTYAVDSTSSADIKAKLLEDFNKAVASKAARLKQEVNRKLKNKAYTGSVKSKSDISITLVVDYDQKTVSINQDTIFESEIKSKSKFSAKTIIEGNFIAALGDADETGALLARKIILLPGITDRPKSFLWGQIISISDLLTLRDKDFKNVAVSLSGSKLVKLNDFVILTGSKDKNDIFKAGFVYVIPQGGIIKPTKLVHPTPNSTGATTSAKTATKSASPKPASR